MTKTYLNYRPRIAVLAGFIILSWLGLCFRLFQVQILNGEIYQKAVVKQSQKKLEISPVRGNIFDRDNRSLTRNIIHYTLSVNPTLINEKEKLAEEISKITGKPKVNYLKKMNSNTKFEFLERNIQIEDLGLLESREYRGLNIEKKYRRYYPHNNIAAQILGYTNLDDEGISGIEKDFNNYLSGTPGWILKTKGWSGQIQHKSGMPYQRSIDGNNIQLTIDLEYQSILEEELETRQLETSAVSATGIIMDPETGEILALATTPGFNNNKFNSTQPDLHRIRAITDQFEPGSTFKVVPAVSAINSNEIKLDNEFNCENGSYEYYTIMVNDHESHGMLTIQQIIQYSSNIGIIKIIEKVGAKALFSKSREFGFGSKTGISLNGEISGKLSSYSDWSAVSLGQIAMGHEIGVTAIQIALAYCAVANGGYLLKPQLIKQIMDYKGNIVYSEKPVVVRKIATENTMADIRRMLRSVITNGTGTKADIKGWKIAGKTGTAQKWKDGKYSNNKFISNFTGFFPYEKPQLLAFIMLDEPKKPFHWGNEGAAVAFNRIIKRIINMDDSIVPPKIDKTKYHLNKNNIIAQVEQKNNTTVPLSMVSLNKKKISVPELRGLSMRKAMNTLNKLGLEYKVNGSGIVFWQYPAPGLIVDKGSLCEVGLK
ncbi:MAG: penicillin-binding protein [Candidatus Neomarinimicrobiota bacterium]